MAADIPEGFREEWVEEDARWRLATPEEQAVRPCRASPQHRCPNTVAAALNRGRYTQTGRTDAWWFYCPDHLYGRRIQNGRILHRRLIPTNPNTGPNIPPPPADAETASDTVTRASRAGRMWSVWQPGFMSGWMAGGSGRLTDSDARILNGPWGKVTTDDPTTVIVGWRKIRFLPLRLVTTWVNGGQPSRRLTFARPTLDWLRRSTAGRVHRKRARKPYG